ncbi:MAG: lactoylglutathione lyase [Flavobacteriales bacterium]|nr:lactoylglutathione lyase [Flavobacteriales bacterium]MCB9364328.1 lactoylglutathione lyase [Flavobacteriales bacterium]
MISEFILYVANQEKSKQFYEKLLTISPSLHVPGMTEFQLSENCKLGLMPEEGIAKILKEKTPHPKTGKGIPRCELYLKVVNASDYIQRGLELGAKEVSPFQQRDWGDQAGYIIDMDGHVIVFAEL